jgi:hypothetical protein
MFLVQTRYDTYEIVLLMSDDIDYLEYEHDTILTTMDDDDDLDDFEYGR